MTPATIAEARTARDRLAELYRIPAVERDRWHAAEILRLARIRAHVVGCTVDEVLAIAIMDAEGER
jgi:hypothetical protein